MVLCGTMVTPLMYDTDSAAMGFWQAANGWARRTPDAEHVSAPARHVAEPCELLEQLHLREGTENDVQS